MKRNLSFAIIIGIVFSIMTGCVVRNKSSAHNTIKEGTEISDIYTYNVEDDFKRMKLEINLTLNKGKVKFELKDPNGNIQWSEEVTTDKALKEIKSFDKVVGEWTLTFENIDNTGEGEFDLQFNRL
ncbi:MULTISPECIES: hypothetical protein [unclassified Clostridium]|uniref:hypothetical protein n=1 Tax=unclassified Clostridium TaxID=2614128 RepID=UPI001898B5B3|nr:MULTISPECIES: hypothetical protein [unclassified Clostridium]MCR1950610.1 hypothetical protein [Clostridium sp. DSM 100503]